MAANFQNKPVFLLGGIIAMSITIALVALVLFWPQPNPSYVSKVSVITGSTLGEISKQLYEKKIISNEQMFRWAVQLMGKEKEIPIGSAIRSHGISV